MSELVSPDYSRSTGEDNLCKIMVRTSAQLQTVRAAWLYESLTSEMNSTRERVQVCKRQLQSKSKETLMTYEKHHHMTYTEFPKNT